MVLVLVTLAVCSLTAAPCNGSEEIVVQGVKAEGAASIKQGSLISVSYYTADQAPVLVEETTARVSHELELMGYTVTDLENSEYHLFFGFGTKDVPAGLFYQGRDAATASYMHYFALSVIESVPYRENGDERLLWKGLARLDNVTDRDPDEPLLLLNRLIVASTKFFGENKRPQYLGSGKRVMPATVVVQHILIGFKHSLAKRRGLSGATFRDARLMRNTSGGSWRPPVQNNIDRTKREARVLVEKLLAQIQAGDDFDDLAFEFSDDRYPGVYKLTHPGAPRLPESHLSTAMPPRFAEIAFDLNVGEVDVSKYHTASSPFGWHIIKRIE